MAFDVPDRSRREKSSIRCSPGHDGEFGAVIEIDDIIHEQLRLKILVALNTLAATAYRSSCG